MEKKVKVNQAPNTETKDGVIKVKENPIPAKNSSARRLKDLKQDFKEKWDVRLMFGMSREYTTPSFFIRINNKKFGAKCTFDYPIEYLIDHKKVQKMKKDLLAITLMKEKYFSVLLKIVDEFIENGIFEEGSILNEFIVPNTLNVSHEKLVMDIWDYIQNSGQCVDYSDRAKITKETIAVRLTDPADVRRYGKNTFIVKGEDFKSIFGTTNTNVIGSYHEFMYNEGIHIREATTDKRRSINKSKTCIGFCGYVYKLDSLSDKGERANV